MSYNLLISAVLAILLLGQPAALAQPLTTELQSNSSELTNISVTQETSKDEEQNPDAFDWQKQLQQIQTATSQLLEPVVTTEYISDIKSGFQSKISDLAIAVNLNKLQEDVVSNISTSLDTAQEWSKNLVADTKDAIRFQTWATGLSSNLNDNLENLQEWGKGLVANLKDNVSILSEELDRVQQDAETEGNPQELTAIKQAEQMAATLLEQLNQVQKNVDTETTPQELAAIKQAEQMAATLLEQLNQVQQDAETEGSPQELAEIKQAEQLTSILSEELNEMQQAAETKATLSEELEELNELQEAVEVNEEVPDAVAVSETDPQAVGETETATSEIYNNEEAENVEDLAELEMIPPEEIANVSETDP